MPGPRRYGHQGGVNLAIAIRDIRTELNKFMR